MSIFNGLSAFPLTSTDAAGNVRGAQLTRFLDRIITTGADSIGLLGSTGGHAYLLREQRQNVVRIAVGHVAGRGPVIVGVGALRTDEAVSLAQDAKAVGADGLLLAPMSYTPLTGEEVVQHIAAVAEAGRLPLCIYNNPGTTRFTFSDYLIARIATLPHVVAVKMPLTANGDYAGELSRLRNQTSEGFEIGYSGDWGAANALIAGCDAWYSVIAGLLPAPAVALTRAAKSGDTVDVQRLDAAFHPLWNCSKPTEASAWRFQVRLQHPPRITAIPATQPSQPFLGRALSQGWPVRVIRMSLGNLICLPGSPATGSRPAFPRSTGSPTAPTMSPPPLRDHRCRETRSGSDRRAPKNPAGSA